jgi:gas vesicle protein
MSKKPAAYLAGSVLLGTAIGTVIGLLSSPASGRKARGLLRGKLNDTRALLKEPMKHLPGLAQQTGELRHRIQEEATERLDPLKRKLQSLFGASEDVHAAGDKAAEPSSPRDGESTEARTSGTEEPFGR